FPAKYNRSTFSPVLMEFLTTVCIFLLFSFMLVKLLNPYKGKESALKLPPGPKPLPIIGNLHHLGGSQMHHILRDLANQYGPLMHLKLGQVSTLIVSSPEVAEEFMKTHDIIFANRPRLLSGRILNYDCTDIAFSPFGNYWRQLRRICKMELLSPQRVQTFRSIREEEVMNLIESISSNRGSTINLSSKILSLTYGITARAAFGKKSKYQEDFISLVKEAIIIAAGFTIADMYPSVEIIQVISQLNPKLRRLHKNIDAILENIVNDHKEKSLKTRGTDEKAEEDLVDVLLNIQKSGEFGTSLTNSSIKSVVMDIFSAGSETSSTTVEWVMSEMLKNPDIMKRAQDEVREVYDRRRNVDESRLHELEYLQAVVKETLRLHPSAPLLLPRENSEQCEVNGYVIPVNTRVIINAWALGRDSKYWTEAEKFKPERFLDCPSDYHGNDFKYMPFGAGRRICPGISFALASIELQLAQLLYHFDWKLPNEQKPEQLDMSEGFALTVRRKNDLYLIPIPSSCSFLE
ncbi:tabersonine 16-hydroxylase 2-like, partial [Coffea arabica]|uniref:Tabersonine 16-hydroxylase 2-like n=2 Tax=Coffea TaxID=13442 RepID=A0A6P6S717_COFAR